MISVNYHKRKNLELFKSLESPKTLFITETQNYIPIYNRFFSLNESNYNSINLNHKWYMLNINTKNDDCDNLYNCRIKNVINNKTKDTDVFFKMAPLLDPYKFLIGKYNPQDTKFFNLPKMNSSETDTYTKFLDVNNSAYVDGFFLFLTSNLIHNNKFFHGVDYYGSFLSIKNDFKMNVFDDIDYLNNSEYFNKNKNVLFTIEDYQHLFQEENEKLPPIVIQHNSTAKSCISIKSFNDEIFEDIFEENKIVNLDEVKNGDFDLLDITNIDIKNNENALTIKSNSTCSSRSSHTSLDENEDCENCENMEIDDIEEMCEDDAEEMCEDDAEEMCEDNEDDDDDVEDDDDEDEEKLELTIPKFPVQVICMENCENTFDDLIMNNDLSKEEWLSAFMQIIMILITYQKTFGFTHNDLHTNNVMYNETDKKYIYYCYKKKYYKVPTFGRIFKIIDFGRAIFKFNGNLFCSNSFQPGGDAASQYNIEPYFNDKKPRLEPNYSFDLCRLACSIFDYVIDDISEVKDLSKCDDPVKKIIVEWCLDDKGINMLYKNNGMDRYPEFKLYKMIARCVHNHTPQAQLSRPEFDAFSKFKGEIQKDNLIDIDSMPIYM